MPIWHRNVAASRRFGSDPQRVDNTGTHDNDENKTIRHYKSTRLRNLGYYCIKTVFKKKLRFVVPFLLVAFVCIYFLVLHEYAWVYHRCFVALVVPTLEKQIFCQEAWSHMVANYDPALLWPPELVKLSAREQLFVKNALADVRTKVAAGSDPSVKDVHYTLTAPMSDVNTRELGKCSVEGIARLCKKDSCRVNIWVVDRAAASVVSELNHEKKDASSVVTYLWDLVNVIQSTAAADEEQPPPQYCIRIINDPPLFDERTPLSPLLQDMTAGCPPPTRRSLYAGKRMREWLRSHQAREKQIPEHASDAWRLVALLEWGGLYVDMDVLPLSPLLLRIPQESIPVQHRVGAYRVNGGVLRLGDGVEEDEAWAKLEGMHESRLRKSLLRQRSTFLKAMEEDHMYWAPRLSRLPAEEQCFGFLGPAALTRVFSAHSSYSGKVTVLPNEMIEPIIDSSLCRAVEDKRSVAAHFSGKTRKKTWRSIMKRNKCLVEMMQDICPRTIGV